MCRRHPHSFPLFAVTISYVTVLICEGLPWWQPFDILIVSRFIMIKFSVVGSSRSDLSKDFGEALRSGRKQHGRTQEQLAGTGMSGS